jgi:hydrogenase maturation factor
MITKFKIFENNSKLEVGDYVLIHTEATNETIFIYNIYD